MNLTLAKAYAAADADAEVAFLKARAAGRSTQEAIAEMRQAFRTAWRELMGY